MSCSPAQLEANRRNALRSIGPKTPEGKAQSRRNALKHGLTGAGIVLPTEDAAEVERRFEALEVDMNPKGELSRLLVQRVAFLSLRLERCAVDEAKCASHRMRHAKEQFVDQRRAEAEKTYSWIATEPATGARRLRGTPEGIDLILDCFERIRDALASPEGVRWDWTYCEQVHHLMGRRRHEVPVTRVRALSEAIEGNFKYLNSSEGADLDDLDRRGWAAGHMIRIIEDEIASLVALRASLDHETIELDLAEAPHRAMFDPSPAATLARKYEATAERGFFRALREFREAQAESPDVAVQPDPAGPDEVEVEESGSFFPVNTFDRDEAAGTIETTPNATPRVTLDADFPSFEGREDGPSDLGPVWR